MKTSSINRKCVQFIAIVILLMVAVASYGDITPVSDRTPEVRDAIVAAISDVDNAADVTEAHLATIIGLNLRNKGITELKSGDFSGLTSLTNLNLFNNRLSSLPDNIFNGLAALTTLRLGSNTVDPMPITVSLEKVGTDQFKAVAPTGAPFAVVVPISATNGSIADSATSLTIAKGSTESSAITITRTANSTEAVTADIGTLPSLPIHHYGYVFSKSANLPLEVISGLETPPTTEVTPPEIEVPPPTTEPEETPSANAAPTFTDGSSVVRTIAENTAANSIIGTPVSATDADNDTLTYTLGGIDAASFAIDSTTGQLKTKAALDYEMRRVYVVSVSVSDDAQTATISVIISVIDIADTPLVSTMLPVSERTEQVKNAIVAAVSGVDSADAITATHLSTITSLNLLRAGITALKTGDFAGLTALTSLNLYGNMLNGLPVRIFEELTALTSLRLGGNVLDPMPLIVSVQQVSAGQFRAVVPTGAPFDVNLLVNGSTITIPKGSIASAAFTSVSANVSIGELPSLPPNHFGYVLAKSSICSRTQQVSDAITAAVPNITDCRNVSDVQLAAITSLDLSGMSIASLDARDFAGMLSLTTLNLSNNQLTSLPDGIIAGLTNLEALNLSGNTASPIRFSVSLQKVGSNMVKAFVPTGAPFDMRLPIIVVNGSTSGSSELIVQKGMTESEALLVTRASNTGTVTADIGTLPNLPSLNSGYALTKTNTQPLEIFSEINVAPVFTEGTAANRSIAENTDAGTNIGNPVTATDANNDTLTYTLGGTDAIGFDIDSTSGQLKTKSMLDYVTKTSYSVTITVTDGSLTDTIAATITVTDVDEAPPKEDEDEVVVIPDDEDDEVVVIPDDEDEVIVTPPQNSAPTFIDGNSTTRSVAENTESGQNIGSPVSATDADEDTLTYTLSGTDAVAFSIDSGSGQLQTSAAIDYETKTFFSVTITVSDGSLSDSISVTINVTNIDETTPNNAPVFNDGNSTTRSVAENTAANTNIGSAVSATDADEDTLTYSLDGTDASVFSIDSSSGLLITNAALDYETKDSYSLTITVSDDNGGTDSISVTINITDVNEDIPNNEPVFTEGGSAIRSIAENTGSGVDIGTPVSATDADGDTLTYSLEAGDTSAFSIDSSSGQLRTDASLDYETKDTYSVTVSVSDANGGSDSISVTINITNVDETPTNNAPEFTEGDSTSRSVDENTRTGVDIGSAVSSTDADDDTLTYTLGGTDAASFSINSSSGQLRTSASLDYEIKTSYSVIMTVSDENGGSDSISILINVIDVDETPVNNPPVFASDSITRSVNENSETATNIGSLITATDADNDTLTYGLIGTDAASFDIDSNTGQLKTKASLNHETKGSYSVIVTVSDGKGGSDSISVTINVTDLNEAPMFAAGSTTRVIAENTAPNTNIGAAVVATDPDDGATLTYTLGGTNGASFSIDSKTGQLKTQDELDFETKNTYSVTIAVSDGSLTDTISVTINLTNLDETPSNNPPVFTDGETTTRSVAENTATGTNIGKPIAATDADQNTLAYALSGDDAAAFSIDLNTGQLKTNTALNYEVKNVYKVTVTVNDGGDRDTITLTINVTDVNEAPAFADDSKTYTVAENTVANTNLGSPITATDPDGDDLTYTVGGDDAVSFDIDENTGQLKTKAALDYETKSSYAVNIIATDGNLEDSISVTIKVTDIDENRAPAFTDGDETVRSVAENTGSGVNIGDAVSATDPDDEDLTYTVGGTDAASFNINSTNGQLRTKDALDYETKRSYSVTITVSDGKKTDSIAVTINITNVDENRAPAFASASTTRSIAETTGSGVNIGDAVSATDPDDDALTYTLDGTDASSFNINSTNGQLRTKDALDFEDKPSYTVTITASDGKLTDSITVSIKVTDVDENRAPAFASASTTRSVPENTAANTNIGDAVSATDPDDDALTYTLGGTDAASFDIVSTSGQLKTKSALDYETNASYTVTISVSDGKESDSISVTINITNVDENRAPVFTDGDSTTRSIAENTAANTNIGDAASATDPDDDNLTYTLGGTDAASFDIGSTSGQLKTKSALDYETNASYTVTITASDGNLSDSITVTINVTNVDENRAPVFTDGNSTTRSIAENTAANTNIGDAVSATDPDDDTLTYTLEGTDAASFDIVSTSGQLKTKSALDYETNASYTVTITASDGNLSDSITVTINVTNVDENRAPVFTDGNSTTRSVAENTDAGTNIGTPVAATDAENDDLTYTLGGTNAASFDIVSTSGQLKTKSALDYETNASYTVTVSVSDSKSGTDSITVTINITDDTTENNAPVFTDGTSATRSIAENTDAGTNIGAPVAATDADDDTLTYSIGGTDAAAFSLASTTGQLKTVAPLDYENKDSYSVTITVTDGRDGYDSIGVTINISNIHPEISEQGAVNNAPMFDDGESTTRSVEEGTATGTNIGDAISATDADTSDTLTYTLSGTDAASFTIVSTTGQLRTSAALDYDTNNSYSVTVTVYDGEGGTDTISVTINVTEIGANNAPVFTDGETTTRSVNEGQNRKTVVGSQIAATDADDDTLTYTIVIEQGYLVLGVLVVFYHNR